MPSGARSAPAAVVIPADIANQLGSGTRPHIGLIGCGPWGASILRDLKALRCPVTVSARAGGPSEGRARAGGADAIVAEPAALPPDVRGIVIATAISHHAPDIEAVLDRGVPLSSKSRSRMTPPARGPIRSAAPDRLFLMEKWRYHHGVSALPVPGVTMPYRLSKYQGLYGGRLGRGTTRRTRHSEVATSRRVRSPQDGAGPAAG